MKVEAKWHETTYKRDACSQQQDPDEQVLELLNDQLPDALAWETQTVK